ncbi:hypothetical protein J2S53_003136 [Actinopolyspora lacussalsi]|nr:hypothetical protein [Actinopolyspora lacussalsi]
MNDSATPKIDEQFFLFIGSTETPEATSKLKTVGTRYKRKRLDSGPDNWDKINLLLESPFLKGAIIKLSARTWEMFTSEMHAKQIARLLGNLEHTPHVVFAHDSILKQTTPKSHTEKEPEFDEDFIFLFDHDPIDPPSEADIEHVRNLFNNYEINLIPYNTNAELGTFARRFVDDNDKHLLFRVYIPSGKMWSSEADKLLNLFRDWISRIKRKSIRQDGYATSNGEVYEFFSDDRNELNSLSGELSEFSDFLDLCIKDPAAASTILEGNHIDPTKSSQIIEKYAKEARRIEVDLRQARETKLLSIRHRLESEFINSDQDLNEALDMANSMVPSRASIRDSSVISHTLPAQNTSSPNNVTINQIFGSVQHLVSGELNGTTNYGTQANELLELIDKLSPSNKPELETAVHEIEDQDASDEDRRTAGNKIKGFLFLAKDRITEIAYSTLQAYIESKLGI